MAFSWKRAAGISAAKARVSRAIGVPMTAGGRKRKVKRMKQRASAMLLGVIVLAFIVIWKAIFG